MEKKLEVEMFRYGSLLFGKTIYIDEGLRGMGELARDKDGYSIVSRDGPDVDCNTLYINGRLRKADGQIFTNDYRSVKDADIAAKHFKNLIDKINQDDESIDIMRVI